MVFPNENEENQTTFVLLFARNEPSCDLSYLMAKPNNELYPMLLSTTFYFLRDLIDYRAIVLNNSVFVIGGRYASTGRLSCSVFKYDAELDSWKICDSLKAPRVHFAVTTIEDKIYVIGGEGLKGIIIQTIEVYDPTIDRWKEIANLSKPRRFHAAATINNRIWSCGGASSILESQTTNELVTLEPRPDDWKRSMNSFVLPEPRQNHCLISVDKTAFLLGGCERNGEEIRNIHEICQVKPRSVETTAEWETLETRLIHPRVDAACFQLGNFVYVVGGHDAEQNQPTKIIERIDLTKENRPVKIEEQFQIDKDFSSIDCCVVRTNRFNQHFLPLASYLDRWVVW